MTLAKKKFSHATFALSLALVTILAPAATDMYIVSMPEIATYLQVSYGSVQLTLTVFLFAEGAGQLVFGPITDRFGRRLPLLIGIFLFVLASIWAGTSSSLGVLLVSRFLQGLMGAMTLVICRSSVRDVSDGIMATKIFAILLTVEGLAPVFAPIIGGWIDSLLGWRAVLFTSAVMGVLALCNTYFLIPETLPEERRRPLEPKLIVQTYRRIFKDKSFLLPTFGLAGVFFFLFGYIGGSAYLYQTHFGIPSDTFGLFFGVSGIAMMAGAVSSSRLIRKIGYYAVARLGLVLIIVGMASALICMYFDLIYWMACGFSLSLAGMGMGEAALVSLSMGSQKTALGSTAALMGAIQMILASLATPISGFLLPVSITAWFLFFIAASALTLGIVFWAEHVQKQANIR